MNNNLNTVLKYLLILVILIMLFVLVISGKIKPNSFQTLLYLIIGALGGYHAKRYITNGKEGD